MECTIHIYTGKMCLLYIGCMCLELLSIKQSDGCSGGAKVCRISHRLGSRWNLINWSLIDWPIMWSCSSLLLALCIRVWWQTALNCEVQLGERRRRRRRGSLITRLNAKAMRTDYISVCSCLVVGLVELCKQKDKVGALADNHSVLCLHIYTSKMCGDD